MSGTLSLTLFFGLFTLSLFLAFWPIWRKADLVRKRLLLVIFLLTPIASVLLYQSLGAYPDLMIRDEYQRMSELAIQGGDTDEADWDALLDKIRTRVEQSDKAEYWYLLAGSYEESEQYDLASEAFELAAETYVDDVSILSRWAESEFINQGYNLTPKVEEIAQRVLKLDQTNAVVLGLLGIAAFQDGQLEPAIQFWNIALSGLPPMSENAQLIQASIIRAQQILYGAVDGQVGQATNTAVVDSSAGIALNIQLDTSIVAAPETTVFVFARIPGSPIPTAVSRLTVEDLPAQIVLDNSMVMIPGTNLLALPSLEVVARLSYSGQPAAQAGDYEVISVPIAPAELDAVLELNISYLVN
jgi:cytochrome c-type biogenesis protein CcmH